jgi:hypothetical protein
MEQRAVINFFTLKGLKAKTIHTELDSGDRPEALTLPTMKKWWRRFQQGPEGS